MADALPYLRDGLALLDRLAQQTPEQVRHFWEDQDPEPQGPHRPGLARLYLQLMDVRMQVDHLVFDVFDRLAKERYVRHGSTRVADAVRADPRDSAEVRAMVERLYPLANPYDDAPSWRKRTQEAERALARTREQLIELLSKADQERGALARMRSDLEAQRRALDAETAALLGTDRAVTRQGVHGSLLRTLARR